MEQFEEKLARVLAERIELADYDPSWPSVYATEVARLAAFFPPGSILRVEHVGSTAVPGSAAKPIVDILVGVREFGFVDDVASRMEAAGYDYFLRPAFGDDGPRYPWFIGRDTSGRRVSHIHVALVDDDVQWDRVLFRDRLRRCPEVALEYVALKRELAARFPDDREAYTLGKTPFIRRETAAAKKYTLRAFGPADLGPLHELIQSTIGASYTGVYPTRAVRFFEEYHTRDRILERHAEGEVVVVERDGELVATGALVGDHIAGVFVHPHHQRCGLGGLVMDVLEAAARSAGRPSVHLDVSLPSKRFYERRGYGRMKACSDDVGEGQRLDYWTAQKDLPST